MPSAIVVGRGRMGSLIKQTLSDRSFDVIGSYGAQNCVELDTEAPVADVVIDFSNACALPHVLAYVTRTGAALVSGTTGYDESDLVELRSLGEKTRIVYSANYSLGIAVLRRAVTQAARALFEWDIEIVETHHNQKADAPSGTAKLLLHAIDPEGDERVVTVVLGWWVLVQKVRLVCTRFAGERLRVLMKYIFLDKTKNFVLRIGQIAGRFL